VLGTAALVVVTAAAQQPDSVLVKLRKLGLPEAPGSVPVIYVPSAKDVVTSLQESIEAARSWYEKQLNLRAPIVLAVLDAEAREKISDRAVLPHNYADAGLIVIPAVEGNRPTDPSFYGPAPFHEDGHILARRLKMVSAHPFVNELIAQIFSVAYMKTERPDMWVVDDLGAGRWKGAVLNDPNYTPRYTSLADVDYLNPWMGTQNYLWFEGRLGRLADFLTKDQAFPALIEKLQRAFPGGQQQVKTLEEISRLLESLRPGVLKVAGALVGPSTIPRITPSVCPGQAKGGGESRIVVRNDTADPLTVINLDGNDIFLNGHPPQESKILPQYQNWISYSVRAGTSLKLPDGSCLVARDEPTLAVIDKQ